MKSFRTQIGSDRNPVISEIEPFKIPEDTKNFIMSSSITSRMRSETIPKDTILHSYRGSSTEEKLKVLPKLGAKMRNYTGCRMVLTLFQKRNLKL